MQDIKRRMQIVVMEATSADGLDEKLSLELEEFINDDYKDSDVDIKYQVVSTDEGVKYSALMIFKYSI